MSSEQFDSLPIASGSSVPVYDCHVLLSGPDESGAYRARLAAFDGITATGSTERDVLLAIVKAFKDRLIRLSEAGEKIPWKTTESPAPGEVERWIPVHL